MATSPTCPRGHALEPNAVLCTVCWVRIEPVDPVVEAARSKPRRRFWLPIMGASAVVLGVVVGGTIGLLGQAPVAPVAVAEPAAAPVIAPEAPATAEAVSTPEAATPTAEPSTVESLATLATVPLAATVEAWSVALCVPADTETIDVSTRAGKGAEWQAVEASVAVGASDECPEPALRASVSLPELADDATKVKLVSRDAEGEKVQKDKVDAGA